EATVTEIREQVAGSEKAPGMLVRPKLDVDTAKDWWKQRVDLPQAAAKPQAAPLVGTVMPRKSGESAVPDLVDDGRNTDVHSIVEADEPPKTIAMEVPVVADDEGPKTLAMDAVDLKALGLDPASSSGSMPVATADDDDSSGGNGTSNGNGDKPEGKRKK